MRATSPIAFLAVLLLAGEALPAAACGTCGCSLNSDWVGQGYVQGRGFHMDLRFDYFDQDQLRTGTGTVAASGKTLPNEQEIQLSTVNRNWTLDLSYHFDSGWGVDLLLPAADRTHSTIGEGDLEPSGSRSAGLGDARLLARYEGFSSDRSLGLQFGLKLPTGRFDDRFRSGPLAGEPVDRGLQLGSGTTDLIAGLYKFGSVGAKWGYFAQAYAQFPLGSRSGFRPGASLTASGGCRYTGIRSFTPQIQVNLRAETAESGPEADAANSGATLVYLSPGFTADLGARVHLYAFVQVPVFQRVTGYQLEPRSLFSAGIHWSF